MEKRGKIFFILILSVFLINSVSALTKISSCEDFSNIDNLNEDYILTKSLNCETDGIDFIGDEFNGVFDGNGHTISNVELLSNAEGLFNSLGSDGVIKNLNIHNIKIQGNSDTVGGLVGVNKGKVINCHIIDGNIYAEGDTRKIVPIPEDINVKGVGGLVGVNKGVIENCSFNRGNYAPIFYDKYTKGPLEDDLYGGAFIYVVQYNAGGLVGFNSETGVIKSSFASNDYIYGRGNVGGVIGYNRGSIKNSYYMGEDSGDCYGGGDICIRTSETEIKGGLVGVQEGKIENCYASDETLVGWTRLDRYPSENYIKNSFSVFEDIKNIEPITSFEQTNGQEITPQIIDSLINNIRLGVPNGEFDGEETLINVQSYYEVRNKDEFKEDRYTGYQDSILNLWDIYPKNSDNTPYVWVKGEIGLLYPMLRWEKGKCGSNDGKTINVDDLESLSKMCSDGGIVDLSQQEKTIIWKCIPAGGFTARTAVYSSWEEWAEEDKIVDSCSATLSSSTENVIGECGVPAGEELSSSSDGLCDKGIVDNFVGNSEYYTWDCLGSLDDTDKDDAFSCSKNKGVDSVDAGCGNADGNSYSSEQEVREAGTCLENNYELYFQPNIIGDGWTWKCKGTNGEVSCSASKIVEEPVCGNGIKETGEECDDGNTNNNDGCSNECKIISTEIDCGYEFGITLDEEPNKDTLCIGEQYKNLDKMSSLKDGGAELWKWNCETKQCSIFVEGKECTSNDPDCFDENGCSWLYEMNGNCDSGSSFIDILYSVNTQLTPVNIIDDCDNLEQDRFSCPARLPVFTITNIIVVVVLIGLIYVGWEIRKKQIKKIKKK